MGAAVAVTMLAVGGFATGAGLKTKSASFSVADDAVGSAAPSCGKGLKAVSGGFESVDFDPDFNSASPLTYATFRQDKRSWGAEAQGFIDEGTVTAYAYCRSGTGLKASSASAPVSGFGSATATATCERGQKVVSGGYDIPDYDPVANRAFAYESRKQRKRSWVVSIQSFDSDPATLTTYAYCRSGKGVKTKSKPVSVEEAPETGTATAKCKRRQKVVSGGFDSADPFVLPFVSRKQGGRKWTASAYNEESGPDTFTVYAYCEKKQKKK